MTMLVWNILLALVWAIALGPLTTLNLAIGFVVGFLALFVAWRLSSAPVAKGDANPTYFNKVVEVGRFVGFFIIELTRANLRMARYTISPLSSLRPGIVAIPLEDMSDAELTMLANLITLTPGTLSLDVSHDRSHLFVHCMDASDPDAIRDEIKRGFETRVLELWR
jgi:multicomponent Na+:H+ antiporter subunit E